MNLKHSLTKLIDYIFVRGIPQQSIFPVLCFGYEWCQGNKKPSNYQHRVTDSLHFVLKGEGTLIKNGVVSHVKEGECFHLTAHENITYQPKRSNPWLYFWIDFKNEDNVPLYLSKMGFSESVYIKKINYFNEIIDKVELLFTNARKANNYYYQSEALSIISLLFEEKDFKSSKMSSIFRYVHDNFKNPEINANEIAKHFDISLEHLSRLFKKETGKNIIPYITNLRLEESINLLNRGLSIKKVASMVGFESDSYFCKVFKKKYDVSPKQYIK